jgi:type 1 fimbriae regulatory protein FimB
MKSLTQDEILKVLKIASEDRRNLAMILLGFKHGMRASEVCGLELKDLDLKNHEITIRRLKGSLKTTQSIADIQGRPLLSEKRVLRAWLEERGNHPSRFVFVSQSLVGFTVPNCIASSPTSLNELDCPRTSVIFIA